MSETADFLAETSIGILQEFANGRELNEEKWDDEAEIDVVRMEDDTDMLAVDTEAVGDGEYVLVEEEMEAEDVSGTHRLVQPLSRTSQQGSERYCSSCRMMLKRSIFYHHQRLIRKHGRCDIFTPKRFPCKECTKWLATIENLCEHMYQIHGAPTQVQIKTFSTEDEFQEFLDLLESDGNYRMSRGSKTVKGARVQYYRCNRIYSRPKHFDDRRDSAEEAPDLIKETNTKPCLRTEEACTAFFRKAYIADGKIEVRFCDYHLHEDHVVRIPASIHEMSAKKLPTHVIIMVLQEECHSFCTPGSALERRILSITPCEVSAIAKSLARIENNSKNEEVDSFDKDSVQEWNSVIASQESPAQECALNELELAMLEQYERNRGGVLSQFQLARREENRKRLDKELRKQIFAAVYRLARITRSINFKNFDGSLLSQSQELLGKLEHLWQHKGAGLIMQEPEDGIGSEVGKWNLLDSNENDVTRKEPAANKSSSIGTKTQNTNKESHLPEVEKSTSAASARASAEVSVPVRTSRGRLIKRKIVMDL